MKHDVAITSPQPFRLLILTDTNVGGKGGAEQHLHQLCAGLEAYGCQAHVLQLGRQVPQTAGRIGSATFSHLPTGRLLSPGGVRRILQVRQLIQRERYDAVLSYFESSDLIAALGGQTPGMPPLFSSRRDTGFRHGPGMRLAYRLLNPRFSRILAVSEAVRASLHAQGVPGGRIHVIHNGVDARRFESVNGENLRAELGIGPHDPVILMVANLNPVKDHATALQAVATLHRSGRRPWMVLAGDGPLYGALREQSRGLGLEKWTRFIGRRADIPAVLNTGDVFLLTSRTEGLSNAMLEAMAARLPVVATRVGGNMEVVVDGGTGFLVPAGAADEVARAVARLLDDPALREKMGQAGRLRVIEHFSLDGMVRKYVQVMSEALPPRVSQVAV